MNTPPVETVTLTTLGGGVAAEQFQEELAKVLANIADVNTDPESVRSITMRVKIKPNRDRDTGSVQFETTSKLAPVRPANTTIWIGRVHGKGEVVAVESNPKQKALFDEEPQQPTGPTAVVPMTPRT